MKVSLGSQTSKASTSKVSCFAFCVTALGIEICSESMEEAWGLLLMLLGGPQSGMVLLCGKKSEQNITLVPVPEPILGKLLNSDVP